MPLARGLIAETEPRRRYTWSTTNSRRRSRSSRTRSTRSSRSALPSTMLRTSSRVARDRRVQQCVKAPQPCLPPPMPHRALFRHDCNPILSSESSDRIWCRSLHSISARSTRPSPCSQSEWTCSSATSLPCTHGRYPPTTSSSGRSSRSRPGRCLLSACADEAATARTPGALCSFADHPVAACRAVLQAACVGHHKVPRGVAARLQQHAASRMCAHRGMRVLLLALPRFPSPHLLTPCIVFPPMIRLPPSRGEPSCEVSSSRVRAAQTLGASRRAQAW